MSFLCLQKSAYPQLVHFMYYIFSSMLLDSMNSTGQEQDHAQIMLLRTGGFCGLSSSTLVLSSFELQGIDLCLFRAILDTSVIPTWGRTYIFTLNETLARI